MEKKEWYTTSDLAGLPGLPSSHYNIVLKAQRESWKTSRKRLRPGGKPNWVFHFDSLPEETRKNIGQSVIESGTVFMRVDPLAKKQDDVFVLISDPCVNAEYDTTSDNVKCQKILDRLTTEINKSFTVGMSKQQKAILTVTALHTILGTGSLEIIRSAPLVAFDGADYRTNGIVDMGRRCADNS